MSIETEVLKIIDQVFDDTLIPGDAFTDTASVILVTLGDFDPVTGNTNDVDASSVNLKVIMRDITDFEIVQSQGRYMAGDMVIKHRPLAGLDQTSKITLRSVVWNPVRSKTKPLGSTDLIVDTVIRKQ